MLVDLTKPDATSIEHIGGKAYNLHKLTHLGLQVPPAIAVAAHADSTDIQLYDSIMMHPVVQSGTSFAVRSSGVGEDGSGNSCAGIFESYLDVAHDDLLAAINKVQASLHTNRSKMYTSERAVTIDKMGVVIQHMVPADFAGVAFSTCPIEKDDRICLIEVVAGNGDSLVSGKKTPATMRINKITGMARISRHGADNLSGEQLDAIQRQLMPAVKTIEDGYGIPVDIEWAIADGQLYILQARPITT